MSQSLSPLAARLAVALDRERLLGRLRSLVRTPSENPPGDEAAVGALTLGYCEELGLDVVVHEAVPGRPNIVARWSLGDGPTVAFCSHIDVVPIGDRSLWTHDPLGAEVVGGRLHGRGSSDAKGCVAAALEAVAILKSVGARLSGTLELVLVSDEEAMGFKGAGYLLEEAIIGPDCAIVGEPTGLRVVRAQRGGCWMRLTARGRAAHGSEPSRGINAITRMAAVLLELEASLPDITHPALGAPTISTGTISGGAKVNVIPAECVAEVDRRTIPGETRASVLAGIEGAIERARRRYPDVDVSTEVVFFAEPFEVAADAPLVRTVAAATGEVLGRDAELMGFRGASDARFFAERGADAVLLGPGDISLAHTADESIDLVELEQGALSYAVSFARLLGERADG